MATITRPLGQPIRMACSPAIRAPPITVRAICPQEPPTIRLDNCPPVPPITARVPCPPVPLIIQADMHQLALAIIRLVRYPLALVTIQAEACPMEPPTIPKRRLPQYRQAPPICQLALDCRRVPPTIRKRPSRHPVWDWVSSEQLPTFA